LQIKVCRCSITEINQGSASPLSSECQTRVQMYDRAVDRSACSVTSCSTATSVGI
jgi:hypothetical protein